MHVPRRHSQKELHAQWHGRWLRKAERRREASQGEAAKADRAESEARRPNSMHQARQLLRAEWESLEEERQRQLEERQRIDEERQRLDHERQLLEEEKRQMKDQRPLHKYSMMCRVGGEFVSLDDTQCPHHERAYRGAPPPRVTPNSLQEDMRPDPKAVFVAGARQGTFFASSRPSTPRTRTATRPDSSVGLERLVTGVPVVGERPRSETPRREGALVPSVHRRPSIPVRGTTTGGAFAHVTAPEPPRPGEYDHLGRRVDHSPYHERASARNA
mmetsp:Transcript_8915/g.23158  ORF Transcript_8915/g.23158 Transcript_8915/m.23158 type:complete len:273 (+) Transcript_8915:103-921(+)